MTSQPRRPSVSPWGFLLRKTLKAVVVIGVGVAVGVGVVGIIGGKWQRWAEVAAETQLAKAAKTSLGKLCRGLDGESVVPLLILD